MIIQKDEEEKSNSGLLTPSLKKKSNTNGNNNNCLENGKIDIVEKIEDSSLLEKKQTNGDTADQKKQSTKKVYFIKTWL